MIHTSSFLTTDPPTPLRSERVEHSSRCFPDKRETICHWAVVLTHDTVIQHHHDKHLSLHQIAYLRSALTPTNRRNLREAIDRFPSPRNWAICSFESINVPCHTVTHPSRHDLSTIAVLHLAWTGPFSVDTQRGQCRPCDTSACKPCAKSELLLRDVATLRSRFGGRPMGLGRLK
jgi:hypothetical protein